MSESRMNLNLGILRTPDLGKDRRKLPKGPKPNTQMTLGQAIQFIKNKGLPAAHEERLIEAASSRPTGALYMFLKNWKKYLR